MIKNIQMIQVSGAFNEIISKAEKLSFAELTALSKKIIEIQTKRMTDDLPLEEVLLLLEKIRKQLPPKVSERFTILKAKRATENLTEAEYQEYLDLIEVVEMDNAEKVKHVGTLALLRNRPMLELGKELGIFNYN
jgi:CRISPR/Cas system CSM-associated protein Csm4 (group 5 of RAMP superfamily)